VIPASRREGAPPFVGRSRIRYRYGKEVSTLIRVENVTKRYAQVRLSPSTLFGGKRAEQTTAVRSVSFDCAPGRVFCLLGANGAGKTTVLRMIATMLRVDSGAIDVAGFSVVTQPREVRRRLGFLTGSTKLYHRLTTDELVRYHADLHGVSSTDFTERRDRIYDLLDMGDFAGRRIGRLSTGMQQKVSIARTMIHNPEVLVLDEATSGLDVLAARGIAELIRREKKDGKTILFSTHRLGEVVELADDLAVIHEGRILFLGTLDQFQAAHAGLSLESAFIRIVENGES
jgi:sodium transport system ATP-binding protein